MSNDISLTVRLPHELNIQLGIVSKDMGVTKTNLIRSAIHDFLTNDQTILSFTPSSSDKKDRLVLNINQMTRNILENACQKYNQPMNAVITSISILALERSSKWLQATRK